MRVGDPMGEHVACITDGDPVTPCSSLTPARTSLHWRQREAVLEPYRKRSGQSLGRRASTATTAKVRRLRTPATVAAIQSNQVRGAVSNAGKPSMGKRRMVAVSSRRLLRVASLQFSTW